MTDIVEGERAVPARIRAIAFLSDAAWVLEVPERDSDGDEDARVLLVVRGVEEGSNSKLAERTLACDLVERRAELPKDVGAELAAGSVLTVTEQTGGFECWLAAVAVQMTHPVPPAFLLVGRVGGHRPRGLAPRPNGR